MSQRLGRYTLRRAALVAASAVAFVTGLSATSAVLLGEADPGVVSGAPGELVVAVSPTGFGWSQGIRPGQRVVSVSRADDPNGWRIETLDANGPHVAESGETIAALRAGLPLALASLVFGAAAVLLLGTRRQWVLPAAALALVLGSTPVSIQGNPTLSTIAMAASAAVAIGWALQRPPMPRQLSLAVVLAGTVALAYWAVARLNGLPGYDELEWARANLAVVATGLLLIDRAVLPRLAGEPIHMIRPRALDVAAVALLAGLGLVLVYFLSVPAVVAGALTLAGLLLVPIARHRLRPIEDALLADVRRHAAVEGAEAERARLARELHDVPLQELIGIMRRLEVLPGAEHETDDLRAVTGHLRNVAMDLRPPVLDDLGLAAALEYLAEETTTPELPVNVHLDGPTGFTRVERPPEDVETAMFRIAAEAVGNAIHHSRGTEIEIQATVSPARVFLRVSDDGVGIAPDAARDAARQKHMGIASMRRRAQAIDADLTITEEAPGTAVRVVWEA